MVARRPAPACERLTRGQDPRAGIRAAARAQVVVVTDADAVALAQRFRYDGLRLRVSLPFTEARQTTYAGLAVALCTWFPGATVFCATRPGVRTLDLALEEQRQRPYPFDQAGLVRIVLAAIREFQRQRLDTVHAPA